MIKFEWDGGGPIVVSPLENGFLVEAGDVDKELWVDCGELGVVIGDIDIRSTSKLNDV